MQFRLGPKLLRSSLKLSAHVTFQLDIKLMLQVTLLKHLKQLPTSRVGLK
jgi:hypothetical protein